MVADVAAIEFAGLLLQFAQISVTLFHHAREGYSSASGSTARDEILTVHASRTRDLAKSILENDAGLKGRSTELREITRASKKAATELIDLLDTLRVKVEHGNKMSRKWKSFEQALRHLVNEGKIRRLEERLESLCKDLQMFLAFATEKRQDEIHEIVQSLKNQNDILEAKTFGKLDEIVEGIDKTTEVLCQDLSNTYFAQIEAYQEEVNRFQGEVLRVRRQHQILQSLKFDQIKTRQAAIKKSHRNTFNWIFDEKNTTFSRWLESENGFYWIRGKPGSGKSTLMKFLVSHQTTKLKLRKWGNGCTTVMAGHYFWNAGNTMQKSQLGLLQTLLYEVLKEMPDLIEQVCRSRWSWPEPTLTDIWDKGELLTAFDMLAKQTEISAKFCFFIDGLDEYTDRAKRYDETFEDLLVILQTFAATPAFKICASSRPWQAFITAFDCSSWQLKMEDMTKEDISKYVTDNLHNNKNYIALVEQDDHCSLVAKVIVTRAQGVFLWVYLVVQSLLNGLMNGDDFKELLQRLDMIPNDLKQYFHHMLETIEPVYWESTSRIFRVMIESGQALPLLAFKFLDQEMENPQYALDMKIESHVAKEMNSVFEPLKKRLNARGKDLLYITLCRDMKSPLQHQVDFLHRTVRDFFIDQQVINQMIRTRKTLSFSPALSLCRIMLGLSKAVPFSTLEPDLNHVFLFSDCLMRCACTVQEEYETYRVASDDRLHDAQNDLNQTFRLLDELENTNTARTGDLSAHWTSLKDIPKGAFQERNLKNFIGAAIQSRLSLYVKQKITQNKGQIQTKRGRPLLDYALRPTMVTPLQLPKQEGPVLATVQFLLENGADPNEKLEIYGGNTPWNLFLSGCYEHSLESDKCDLDIDEIAGAMEAMLLHGADSACMVTADSGKQINMLEIAKHMELPECQVRRIRKVMRAKEAIQQPGLLRRLRTLIWGELK
ncbi:hypothetical protein CTAM01_06467 [Colletotrichum tamarilloi]|uniref:NACHT domain-containing protein n=1 Tax=Colletotrichum tamarilloi TaxID=1209934 RepID=A0ABQ9RBJ4_9PEZI|nr:uncharacterized protein CTAM01_06467 [Colletotrichum tamarilloi]KAK1500532.1 hypothetical protein CTAM01_06467 [Colletotrichum tamarilloi]